MPDQSLAVAGQRAQVSQMLADERGACSLASAWLRHRRRLYPSAIADGFGWLYCPRPEERAGDADSERGAEL